MTKKQYQKYLLSPHWKQLRTQYLSEHKVCYRCRIPRWLSELAYGQDLHVHHTTYERLGNEEWADLEALCPRCHDIETFGRSDLQALRTTNCLACDSVHWDIRSDLCAVCWTVFQTSYIHLMRDECAPSGMGETVTQYLKRQIK